MTDKQPKRGLKRKRLENPTEKDIGAKIAGKLHHDIKEVRKAAKKAKTFETQKLVKKLKELRSKKSDDSAIKDHEAQLEALKNLEHEPIADAATSSKIKKDHLLSSNEYVKVAVSTELSSLLSVAVSGTPMAKIQSRLLSSKILAVEVASLLADLKSILQPTAPGKTVDEEESEAKRPKIKNAKIKSNDEITASGSHVKHSGDSPDIVEDVEVGEDGWESGSVHSDHITGALDGSSDHDQDDSDDSGDNTASSENFPTAKVARSVNSKAKTKLQAAQSTFLPSLSVGFTRGESDDSEWSDSEAKIADGEQKKNRRGQRARRAIWEKKFGKNANHMKKQQEIAESTIRGRTRPTDSCRPVGRDGFNNSSSGPSRHSKPQVPTQRHQNPDSGWSQRTPHNHSVPMAGGGNVRPQKTEDKPLHPSWEAKRKLKEKESSGILPPQGTKIKFQ